MELGSITLIEVKQAISKLKRRKAAGIDGSPPEFFQALAATSEGLEQIRQLIQICWDSKDLPNDWQTARVQSIFKKGDPSDCNNYRPISLLCIGYKLLATILLLRLKAAGAEARIWST